MLSAIELSRREELKVCVDSVLCRECKRVAAGSRVANEEIFHTGERHLYPLFEHDDDNR